MNGQKTLIIHLADHDPSGLDMTRDIGDRLRMFAGWKNHDIERIALNMSQIEEFTPPPNPTKLSDSRARAYIAEFGSNSWELDALEPRVIESLIERTLKQVIDDTEWEKVDRRILAHKKSLTAIADNYEKIRSLI